VAKILIRALLFSEQGSMPPLFTEQFFLFFFLFANSGACLHCSLNMVFFLEKPAQLIDFTRIVHVNNNFFLFFFKLA